MAAKKPEPLSSTRPQFVPWRVVGERMREARMQAKLTQLDVAYHARISPALVSRLEHDRNENISLDTLGRICDLYQCSADWICGKSERRHRPK